MNTFKRLVASLVIASTALMGLPMTAQAAIVSTDEAMSTPVAAANRDRVNTFLTRADVRKALQEQGVNGDAAVERVKAMSDTEVAQLAGRIDQAPAGGDILGILFTIFIVLLVTDIMGLTKVFPFTRSIR
ncbi:MAG: PA2779 family protein [Rhodoferax sp.]|jgi:glutamate mutase epsilon subunit|nr:PA2779 family protein [Rhodoferax sp.]MBP7574924.1 PA2779 family protein [Rhodoferax sp.]